MSSISFLAVGLLDPAGLLFYQETCCLRAYKFQWFWSLHAPKFLEYACDPLPLPQSVQRVPVRARFISRFEFRQIQIPSDCAF